MLILHTQKFGLTIKVYEGGCFCEPCSCKEFWFPCFVCLDSFVGVFYKTKCPIEKHPKTNGYKKVTCLDYKTLLDEIASR